MSTQKSAIYEYDFAKDGGAISEIPMRLIGGDAAPPPDSIVEADDVAIDVLTVPVGVGASIALRLETAADIQAVAAITGAPWSTTGIKDSSSAGPIKAGSGAMRTVISGAALTAGKFRVYIHYHTLS